MHRIHIVGVSARSGTTLMAECMRLCFEIDRYEKHESPLWKLKRSSSIYLTKSPQDIMYLGARLALDPRLTIVCMMRDPRDVVVSKHQQRPDDYFTSLGRWKYRRKFVEKYASRSRFVLVKYEDFIRDPDGTQDFLVSRIPYLEKTRAFSEFYREGEISKASVRALGGIRPFDPKNTSKWRRHLPRLAEQINRYGDITKELIQYGYEKDRRWAEELSSVEPMKTVSKDKPIRKKLVKYYFTYPISALVAYVCYLFSLSLV
jgi:hypothetical protein